MLGNEYSSSRDSDEEALELVSDRIRRDEQNKRSIIQASQSRDFEIIAQIVSQILTSLGLVVNNFFKLVSEVARWFKDK